MKLVVLSILFQVNFDSESLIKEGERLSKTDEVSENIISDLRKRGKFGGFSEERMQLVLEGIWDKVEYNLKDSQELAGQLEECSDSRVMKSLLNRRTFKYHFGGGRFNMLPQSYEFSHGFCLNIFLQVWFIGNQRYRISAD